MARGAVKAPNGPMTRWADLELQRSRFGNTRTRLTWSRRVWKVTGIPRAAASLPAAGHTLHCSSLAHTQHACSWPSRCPAAAGVQLTRGQGGSRALAAWGIEGQGRTAVCPLHVRRVPHPKHVARHLADALCTRCAAFDRKSLWNGAQRLNWFPGRGLLQGGACCREGPAAGRGLLEHLYRC